MSWSLRVSIFQSYSTNANVLWSEREREKERGIFYELHRIPDPIAYEWIYQLGTVRNLEASRRERREERERKERDETSRRGREREKNSTGDKDRQGGAQRQMEQLW